MSREQKCKELKDIFSTNLYEMQNLRIYGLRSVVKMNLLHKSNQNIAEKLKEHNCNVSYIPDCLDPPCITSGDASKLKKVLKYIKSPKISKVVVPPKKQSRFRTVEEF